MKKFSLKPTDEIAHEPDRSSQIDKILICLVTHKLSSVSILSIFSISSSIKGAVTFCTLSQSSLEKVEEQRNDVGPEGNFQVSKELGPSTSI